MNNRNAKEGNWTTQQLENAYIWSKIQLKWEISDQISGGADNLTWNWIILHQSGCVCMQPPRQGWKQQSPLRRSHPHGVLVTRWVAGSPLSLASWDCPSPAKRWEAQFFQPPHPHLPTPAYSCCDYRRPVPNRELPPDINSHAIIVIPLWRAFAENLKRWLRISGNVSHCELMEASAQSYMKTHAVNVIGNQWGQNSHTRQH